MELRPAILHPPFGGFHTPAAYKQKHMGRLMEKLRVAEQNNNPRAISRLALALAGRLMRDGKYQLAAHWAQWSLDLYQNQSPGCTSYMLMALEEWALCRQMLGEEGDLEQDLQPWLHNYPQPYTRWAIRVVQLRVWLQLGRIEETLEGCTNLWKAATNRKLLIDIANLYIQILLKLERLPEALKLAERLLALAATLDQWSQAKAALVYGVTQLFSNPERGCEVLEAALPYLRCPWDVQAALYLAYGYQQLGQPERGMAVLEQVATKLEQVSPSGLAFLGSAIEQPSRLFDQPDPSVPLELRFLGDMECRHLGQNIPLRLRFAEFLTILSHHPEGLSAEQLSLAVYGETGDAALCKTELGRFKQTFPLASRPYRLMAELKADYLELPRLLQKGEILKAIDLYRGPLLSSSQSPEVCGLRRELEEGLCRTVIESANSEYLWRLGAHIHDDLELWEAISENLRPGDPRRGMAQAHVNSLKRSWGV